MRRRRTTGHEKVLYSRQERGNVRDRYDTRAVSRTTNMIEDAAQAPLSIARALSEARRERFDPGLASCCPCSQDDDALVCS